jgi:hypothetical protein
MKRNFTRLAGILTGLPFACLALTGQTAVRNTVQTAERFDRVRAESPEARRGVDAPALQLRTDVPEARLRADEKPWPDSVVTYTPTGEKLSKGVYTYNAAGVRTLYEYFMWEGGKWVNSDKTEYTYNAAGYATKYEGYRWENGKWVALFRDIYAYDNAGNQTSYESYEWEDNRWVGWSKYIYAYDGARQRTLFERYKWESDKWVTDYKYVYAYDDAGNQILYERYSGENNVWVELSKYTYAYDSKGLLISTEDYIWENNRWEITWKATYRNEGTTVEQNKVFVIHYTNKSDKYNSTQLGVGINIPSYGSFIIRTHSEVEQIEYNPTYDASGNLTQLDVSGLRNGSRGLLYWYVIGYESNSPVSVEAYFNNELYSKIVRQYDAIGRITLQEVYRWNFEENRIATNSKRAVAYDATGREILDEYYTGDESGNGWVGTSKYEYEYDADGRQLSYAYYNWDNGNWNGNYRTTYDERDGSGRTVVYSEYAWQSGRWEKSSYTVYYPNASTPDGTEAVAAIAEAWSHAGSLYVRTAQPAALSVYTLSGALLTRQTLAAGETVIPLPQGIYIVRIGNTAHKIAVTK